MAARIVAQCEAESDQHNRNQQLFHAKGVFSAGSIQLALTHSVRPSSNRTLYSDLTGPSTTVPVLPRNDARPSSLPTIRLPMVNFGLRGTDSSLRMKVVF